MYCEAALARGADSGDFVTTPRTCTSGWWLTLEDVVEFFNLVQELKLSKQEKAEIVAFVRPDQT